MEGGKASGHWEAGDKAGDKAGGNAVTLRARIPLVTAKLGATWGQRRNFEGGKASGHWEAGGKAGGKVGGNLGAKLGATP